MKQEIKAEWLRRLRSGEYEQLSGQLGNADTNERCCLGVLCDIAAEKGVVVARPYSEEDNSLMVDGACTVLPFSVSEWAGLGRTIDPDVQVDEDYRSLSDLNDSGYTFAQIADVIEEYL